MLYPIPTRHYSYISLLVSLLSIFIISPFLEHNSFGENILSIALFLTLIFSILVGSNNQKLIIIATFIVLPLILESLLSIFINANIFNRLFTSLCGVVFFLIIITLILGDMLRATKVNGALIIGSISSYLLLGLMWGFVYMAIEQVYPNSFDSLTIKPIDNSINEMMYFSMVTLTTLGYGDIVPISAPARAMAGIESLAGQMYLTIMVAQIVGMHIAQKNAVSKPPDISAESSINNTFSNHG